MKKVVKKSKVLVSVLILTLVVAMLSACGSSKNSIVGTWALTSAEGEGISMSAEALESMGLDITMEFKEDGTVSIDTSGVPSEGTYKQDGTTISVTIAGVTEDMKFENNIISLEDADSGYKMNFELQK